MLPKLFFIILLMPSICFTMDLIEEIKYKYLPFYPTEIKKAITHNHYGAVSLLIKKNKIDFSKVDPRQLEKMADENIALQMQYQNDTLNKFVRVASTTIGSLFVMVGSCWKYSRYSYNQFCYRIVDTEMQKDLSELYFLGSGSLLIYFGVSNRLSSGNVKNAFAIKELLIEYNNKKTNTNKNHRLKN